MDEDLLFDEHEGDRGTLHRVGCPEVAARAVLWPRGVAVWRPEAPHEHRGLRCWPRVELMLGIGMAPKDAA